MNISAFFYRTCLACMASVLLVTCDAPRINPFDPDAENYSETSRTQIFVRRIAFPNLPIQNAEVKALNIKQIGVTNANGLVEFMHDPLDTLHLVVSAEMFFTDTVFLATEGQAEFQILLNAIPVMENVRFFSVFENWNDNRTHLEFIASLTDIDGQSDIIDVRFSAPSYTYEKSLVLVGNQVAFHAQTQSNYIYLNEIDEGLSAEGLADLNFFVSVTNFNGDSVRYGPYRIIRTIQKNLEPLTPDPQEEQVGNIFFSWEPVDLSYVFNYRIILQNGSNNLSWIYSDIGSDRSSFLLGNPPSGLQDGVHFWFFQAYDPYGNACESNIIPFSYTRQ